MFENLSSNPKPSVQHWLITSLAFLLLYVLCYTFMVILLNRGFVNHLLTPIFQYLSLFSVLWEENWFGALQFLAKKSLLALAHQDGKSGLNLWTIEFDSITTFVYIVTSLTAGQALSRYWLFPDTVSKQNLNLTIAGAGLIMLATSYMTSIEHCSGPTWVGFVSLYGMGFDEFQLYPVYQVIVALVGLIMLGLGVYRSKKS